MSINEKRKLAETYKEAVKKAEAQKPCNEWHDIVFNGKVGKVIYYPLEDFIEVNINNDGPVKFNADYAEPLYEALKRLLGK